MGARRVGVVVAALAHWETRMSVVAIEDVVMRMSNEIFNLASYGGAP
jgi:hypothetical protein